MIVKSWYPLICPQVLFKDRQDETNAYLETNPAMHINPDGTFVILVRLVNYRKFHNREFKMGGALSESRYHLFRGTVTEKGFDIIESMPIHFVNNFPQYYSCWTGYEDIRFLDASHILCTSPTSSPTGDPLLVQGVLQGNTVTIETLCQPFQHPEKNWMPFRVQDSTADFVLYSVYPLALKGLYKMLPTILHEAEELKGFHGSSNGIPYKSGYLFLIHKYMDRTQHKWLLFDPVGRKYGFSESFSFHPYSYIEFTCSLSSYNGALYVGLGMNDALAYICQVVEPILEEFKYYNFEL